LLNSHVSCREEDSRRAQLGHQLPRFVSIHPHSPAHANINRLPHPVEARFRLGG
jgi:hypothetical protein